MLRKILTEYPAVIWLNNPSGDRFVDVIPSEDDDQQLRVCRKGRKLTEPAGRKQVVKMNKRAATKQTAMSPVAYQPTPFS